MSRPDSEHFSTAITWASLLLVMYLLFLVLQPFLVPLGWACVLSVLIYPVFARIARRVGPGRAAAISTVASAVILIVPAIVLTKTFVTEMVGIAQSLQASFANGQPSSIESLWQSLIARIPFAARLDLGSVALDGLRQAASFLTSQSGAVLANIAVFLVDLYWPSSPHSSCSATPTPSCTRYGAPSRCRSRRARRSSPVRPTSSPRASPPR